jgi:hypothetical protein
MVYVCASAQVEWAIRGDAHTKIEIFIESITGEIARKLMMRKNLTSPGGAAAHEKLNSVIFAIWRQVSDRSTMSRTRDPAWRQVAG